MRKSADRPEVELIDFINYKLELAYQGAMMLDSFDIVDNLSVGFSCVTEFARICVRGSGVKAIQSEVHQGRLYFTLSKKAWNVDTPVEITYRARVSTGACERVLAVSRAKANASELVSNEAIASVRVVGSVFTQ
ncbi:MAG: hypothetical protein H7240_10330 [Glaciimonas sp.]|nr:hypothetical protein [Glaciimonas sp.]